MSPKELPEYEIESGLRLLGALDLFSKERSTLPMQYLRTFLLVMTKEGLTVGEYAAQSGVSPSVMSRHISDLGPRTRGQHPGLDLLYTKQRIENMREHSVHLTEKGRTMAHKIARHIG
jgi:DNA-binding MarR family transcriptional regulator